MGQLSARLEPRTDSELVRTALRFARRVHLGQNRKQTHEPFVEHPIAVAGLLSEQGFDGPVLAAAYLHDVLEKTLVEVEELEERFGAQIAGLVESLSEDDLDGYAERKRALRRKILSHSRVAVVIYAADRVANLRDWTAIAPEGREACAARLGTTLAERLRLWAEDLGELTAFDPKLPFLAEIEMELAALRTETAG